MPRIRTDKSVKARECAALLLRVPKPKHRALRVIAAKEGMSMAAWAERILFPEIDKRTGEAR